MPTAVSLFVVFPERSSIVAMIHTSPAAFVSLWTQHRVTNALRQLTGTALGPSTWTASTPPQIHSSSSLTRVRSEYILFMQASKNPVLSLYNKCASLLSENSGVRPNLSEHVQTIAPLLGAQRGRPPCTVSSSTHSLSLLHAVSLVCVFFFVLPLLFSRRVSKLSMSLSIVGT